MSHTKVSKRSESCVALLFLLHCLICCLKNAMLHIGSRIRWSRGVCPLRWHFCGQEATIDRSEKVKNHAVDEWKNTTRDKKTAAVHQLILGIRLYFCDISDIEMTLKSHTCRGSCEIERGVENPHRETSTLRTGSKVTHFNQKWRPFRMARGKFWIAGSSQADSIGLSKKNRRKL